MKFSTSSTELRVVLERREQIAALKAKIYIPKSDISSISWHDQFSDWRRWEIRLPGSAIPRKIIAGSYWTEQGWDFLYLKHPVGLRKPKVADVMVVGLKGDSKYQRIVVSTSKLEFDKLNKWLKKK